MMETQAIEIRALIENNDLSQLRELLKTMLMEDIIGVMQLLSDEEKAVVFASLNEALAIKIFKVLEADEQKSLIKNIPHEKAAKLLNDLPPDDRTAFFEELTGRV